MHAEPPSRTIVISKFTGAGHLERRTSGAGRFRSSRPSISSETDHAMDPAALNRVVATDIANGIATLT